MRLEWIGIGAVAPEVHDDLERRFVHCLAQEACEESPANRSCRNHKGDDGPARDSNDRNGRRDGRGRPDGGGRR